MSNPQITFELVTPESLIYSADVGMVVIPGEEGNFGVLAGHAPLISLVKPGIIEVYNDLNDNKPSGKFFVAGGFAEVTPERCTMLAEESLILSDLQQINLPERKAKAEEALSNASTDGERERAERELQIVQTIQEILQRGDHH